MREILKYADAKAAIFALSERLAGMIKSRANPRFRLALSGGETAKLMFDVWRENFANSIDWACVDFFWADERLVDLNSNSSNFRWAREKFFEPLGISDSAIFNVNPRANSQLEALRLEKLLRGAKPGGGAILDCAILGVGSDGHTASIFPNNPEIFNSDRLCEIVRRPGEDFDRFTLTPRALEGAGELLFLALGEGKREVLQRLLREVDSGERGLVASGVFAGAGEAVLFTDSLA